jgi:hypothetical protein
VVPGRFEIRSVWQWAGLIGAIVIILAITLMLVWRDDILRTSLDPKEPFQIAAPPAAPDYAKPESWALRPKEKGDDGRLVDVFFIHPTTYNGGPRWSGPIDDAASQRQLTDVMLPNWAGPFRTVGRVYAPRYRQASLYSYLTLRDDAQQARRFAYGDVERAFRDYLARDNKGRPFIIVGVEQGGFLADRLLRDVVAPDPDLRAKLVAGYLIRTIVAAAPYGPGQPIPACQGRAQARCVVGYGEAAQTGAEHARDLLGRSLLWGRGDDLETLNGRLALCVNPLTGAQDTVSAPAEANLGAANATGVPWEVRPAILPAQVSAHCSDGLLRVSRPLSRTLRNSGAWADRLKAPPFNIFYADLERDAKSRVSKALGLPDFPETIAPITESVPVHGSAIHRID